MNYEVWPPKKKKKERASRMEGWSRESLDHDVDMRKSH